MSGIAESNYNCTAIARQHETVQFHSINSNLSPSHQITHTLHHLCSNVYNHYSTDHAFKFQSFNSSWDEQLNGRLMWLKVYRLTECKIFTDQLNQRAAKNWFPFASDSKSTVLTIKWTGRYGAMDYGEQALY